MTPEAPLAHQILAALEQQLLEHVTKGPALGNSEYWCRTLLTLQRAISDQYALIALG